MEAHQSAKSIGCYKLKSKLCGCEFGQVLIGQHQLTKEPVMIKVLCKEAVQRQGRVRRLARQIALLKRLHHPTIIQLLEMIETAEQIYLVFEYVEGEFLAERLAKRKVKEATAVRVLYELLLCLEYLKKNRVVHGGISQETVFLTRGDHIKLMSLHNSRQVPHHKPNAKPSQKSLDPLKSTLDPHSSDLYDIGLLLHQLLFNRPYTQKSRLSPQKHLDAPSLHARNLLSQLLNKSKDNKLTLENIKYHPWFLKIEHKPICESDEIQVETRIMKELELFGIDRKYAWKCILKNQCNYVTTLYWLLKRKRNHEERSSSHKGGVGGSSKSPIIAASLRTIKDINQTKHTFGRQSQRNLKPPTSKQRKPKSQKPHSHEPKQRKKTYKKFTIYQMTTDRRNSQFSDKKETHRSSKKAETETDDYFYGANLTVSKKGLEKCNVSGAGKRVSVQ